jgi:hypothetical protein
VGAAQIFRTNPNALLLSALSRLDQLVARASHRKVQVITRRECVTPEDHAENALQLSFTPLHHNGEILISANLQNSSSTTTDES